MRGAVTFEEVMNVLTPGIRYEMNIFIEKRFEQESKKMNPIY